MNININKQIQQKTIKKIMTAFGPARTVQLLHIFPDEFPDYIFV